LTTSIRNRVPVILFLYWVIKIASTTLGETGADMFSMTFNLGYSETILIFIALFLFLLALKLWIKKYDPVLYWLVFTSTAIAGTALSDYIDRTLHLGYALGSSLLILMLIASLLLWYRTESSISVESIYTSKAEVFYWVSFLIANTLGTALGDFLADELGIGFLTSAMLIASMLVVTTLLHYYSRMSGIVLFWVAFVLTRPFGATFGDLLTKPLDSGGLNLGTTGASAFFAILLMMTVVVEVKMEIKRRGSGRQSG